MRLQVLELDHVTEVNQEVAAEVCREGLKGLEMLVLTSTPVTPKALLHFNSESHCQASGWGSSGAGWAGVGEAPPDFQGWGGAMKPEPLRGAVGGGKEAWGVLGPDQASVGTQPAGHCWGRVDARSMRHRLC